jgi:hypothetical protein
MNWLIFLKWFSWFTTGLIAAIIFNKKNKNQKIKNPMTIQ